MTQRFPFQYLLHRGIGEDATAFLRLFHFNLDPYLIMLSVKQGGIKYHFWVFGITRPAIEPRSLGPMANTLLIRPMTRFLMLVIYFNFNLQFFLTQRGDAKRWAGSNGNERILHITRRSKTEATSSDSLVLYPGHLLGRSYPSVVGIIYSFSRQSWCKDGVRGGERWFQKRKAFNKQDWGQRRSCKASGVWWS